MIQVSHPLWAGVRLSYAFFSPHHVFVVQEDWPAEVEKKCGAQVMLSVVNINKASFLGSFRVTVSHQVCLYKFGYPAQLRWKKE